jgi:pimeloyl-ACP methyl ester carboxylesterase
MAAGFWAFIALLTGWAVSCLWRRFGGCGLGSGSLRTLAGELLAMLAVAAIWCVETPLRQIARPLARAPRAPSGGRPVIFVHGFLLTPWSMGLLARRVRRAGLGPVFLLDYRPALGRIEGFADQLAELVERVAPDGPVDIVAHSMGGLIAARCMGAHTERVGRLVAVGTPFHGTAAPGPAISRSIPQMRPGSAFLRDTLAAPGFAGHGGVTCVLSRADRVVVPYHSARLPEGMHVELDGLGHNALLFSGRVARAVCAALATKKGRHPGEGG